MTVVFDFVAGELCLDFTNTVNHPPKGPLKEKLADYADLLSWGVQSGQVREAETAGLRKAASRRSGEAQSVVLRARALREAIYAIFLAIADGKRPVPADLETLNAELARALAFRRVRPGEDGFRWEWEPDPELDRLLWPVAVSAAELLTSSESVRVHQCDGDRCAYLFVDSTKNRRRRWCDMKVCGNRAKVRRHRQRVSGS